MKHDKLILLATLGLLAACAGKPKTDAVSAPPTKQTSDIKPITPPATATAASTAAKPTAIDVYVCKRDSDVREVYIEPVSPLGCKLWYSNIKTGNPVASSTKGLTHCETVNQKIRSNLETAGFKCEATTGAAAAKK